MNNRVIKRRRTKLEMMESKPMQGKEINLSESFNTVIGDKRYNSKKNEIVTIVDVKCLLDKNMYYVMYKVSNGKTEYNCHAKDLKHTK